MCLKRRKLALRRTVARLEAFKAAARYAMDRCPALFVTRGSAVESSAAVQRNNRTVSSEAWAIHLALTKAK